VALALVSANIRKILTFIEENLARVPRTTKNKDFAKTYYSGVALPSPIHTDGYASPPGG